MLNIIECDFVERANCKDLSGFKGKRTESVKMPIYSVTDYEPREEMSAHTKDITGNRIGMLTVQSFIGIKLSGKRRMKESVWRCLCDCGNSCNATNKQLLGGKLSCGCESQNYVRATKYDPEVAALRNMWSQYKSRAKAKKIPFELDADYFVELIQQPCFHCGTKPYRRHKTQSGRSALCNGVDRIEPGKEIGYIKSNCVSSCPVCNMAKLDRDTDSFLLWGEELVKNLVHLGLINASIR